MMQLDHSTDVHNRHTLSLSGELDESSCAELAACLGRCRGPGARVQLDLRELNFVDAAGLALLQRTYAEAAREGWSLSVVSPGERYVARARAA